MKSRSGRTGVRTSAFVFCIVGEERDRNQAII